MYTSQTYGKLTVDQMLEKVREHILASPHSDYRIMIGTDSQKHKGYTLYATALIVHRMGEGAIYFIEETIERGPHKSLRERMYLEASKTIELGEHVKEYVLNHESIPAELQVHLDIGRKGKTSAIVKELIGYVTSCGYQEEDIYIKPYSIAASAVADKYTK